MFVLQLEPSSGAINWATQFGLNTFRGSSVSTLTNDACEAVYSDGSYVYCGGTTAGALGEAAGGGGDAFVLRLDLDGKF